VTKLPTRARATKKKATSPKKVKAKSGAKKASAKQQRMAARRLADVWLIHLRARLAGERGLIDPAHQSSRSAPQLASQVQTLLQFRDGISANLNVRMSVEQTLLELGK
jgi:hypothetical protein